MDEDLVGEVKTISLEDLLDLREVEGRRIASIRAHEGSVLALATLMTRLRAEYGISESQRVDLKNGRIVG